MHTKPLLFSLLLASTNCFAGLTIEDLGKKYSLKEHKLVKGLYQHIATKEEVIGGNTSIRNESAAHLDWKGSLNSNGYGYYQRNRDLGQVINVPQGKDIKVDAIVVRSSKGNNALMAGTAGAKMYVQFFKVGTKPGEKLRINDNGTGKGEEATHGFDHQFNRCDDFIEGAQYTPIARVSGGVFPTVQATTQHQNYRGVNEPYGEQPGHLRYFRFDLTEPSEITLKAGQRYAFMIGFEEPAADRGLALAIITDVHTKEDAVFSTDPNGMIRWGIRREGDGGIIPTMTGNTQEPTNQAIKQKLINESLFKANHWQTLPPSTNGYPDVDTYRTLQYYIETK